MKDSSQKQNRFLPIAAAVMIVVASASILIPKLTAQGAPQAAEGQSDTSDTISIDTETVGFTASFYDYDADGTTVEVLAVKASDGTVRLALNTCQVCNGSPYAYFEQDGDSFFCQNCGNRFSSDVIGLESFGCNPIPVTEEDYTVEDGILTVSAQFLSENAERFTNWKQF